MQTVLKHHRLRISEIFILLEIIDEFQTKPLWKLEILQKLLFLKVFFTLVTKTHNYFFFVTVFFNIFIRQTLTKDCWALHKNTNCVFHLNRFSVIIY